jgi:hypothetical protein
MEEWWKRTREYRKEPSHLLHREFNTKYPGFNPRLYGEKPLETLKVDRRESTATSPTQK